MILYELEVDVLKEMAGQGPGVPWGAAKGACLESLKGAGLISKGGDLTYRLTEKGLKELEERKAAEETKTA